MELSLIRRLEYEELSSIRIDGKILDVGGHKDCAYHNLIKGKHIIFTVNIDEKYKFDYKFDIEKKFPIKDRVFDAVICLNVLEHIFNFQNVIDESYRILKNGGIFVGATPFLYNIHYSPSDYFRYSRQCLEKMFTKANFSEIIIKELGTGVFCVIFQSLWGLFRTEFFRGLALHIFIILDKFLKIIKPQNKLSEKYFPLGYFIIARK